jgi:hypothetical protein
MSTPEFVNAPGGKYLPVPAEFDRQAILKAPAPTLREWARVYGFVNLNLRLQGRQ